LIYPTRAAILTAAAGAPVALLIGVFLPDRWYAGLAWPVAVLLLTIADGLRGARPGAAKASLSLPKTIGVGADVDAVMRVDIPGPHPPGWAELAVAADPRLDAADHGRCWVALEEGRGMIALPMLAKRRGTAVIDRLWLRWRGPMGLAWKQRRIDAKASLAILPDIRAVHEHGARLFQRHALQGLMAQIDRGDGADFDSLVEFRSGMDRRSIDWKQSARHLKLHAREYRSERNNQIVFAIDAGRQMSEPVAGLSRLDRVVSAMLLTAWIALKLGDRVALHAFDSRPRVASGLVSGVAAFGELQRLAAKIDYSGEESNYGFALNTLSARLARRSMIVLFTEFSDRSSAGLMMRAVRRLIETHLLLVVVLRDAELEEIVDRPPATADDVTRAVTAAGLLRDRLTLLTELRHMGAHVIESEHDRVGERLVQGYVDLKRRNLL